MSAPKYARIAITLPPDDLAAADRLAAAQDRSRSWIVAEALRQYVARSELLVEPSAALGASRHAQLVRDLQLTAQERIRDAEERDVLSIDREHVDSLETPLRFATYDDFAAWRRALPNR
ncbi:ribbon-helix-helix protein, CopG family [Gemmatimonas sp.]|uniref:ribbon-helix-helix protein, CopG family n=1 Tax=Gemmatimonas sp. TaxID=1962908 RepID=UPI003567B5D6